MTLFGIKNIHTKDRVLLIISKILLVLSGFSLTLFTLYSYRSRFHSDAATAGMIALEQWSSGELFVSGWYYSQDFWPMFVLNSVTALFPLIHDAFLATQIGVFLQTIIIFLTTRKILQSLGSQASSNLVLAFLLSGISFLWSEFFYGQGQYGNVLMFILINTTCVLSLLSGTTTEEKGFKKILIFSGLFFVNTYINSTSIRYVPLFIAPCFLGLFYIFLTDQNSRRKVFYIGSALLISTILGQIGFSFLKHSYIFLSGVDGATLLSYHDAISTNFSRAIEGYLSLIADDAPSAKFASMEGGLFFLRILCCFLFFTAPIYFLLSRYQTNLKTFNLGEKYLVIFFCGILTISVFSVIFLASTVNHTAAARYMMVAIYFGVFVSFIFVESLQAQNFKKYFMIAFIPIMLFNMYDLNKNIFRGKSEREQLANFLINNNLDRGFATYWNADVLTVLSNYKLMISHVEGKYVTPSLFMSTKKFYKAVGAKHNFLLLDESEISSIDFEYLQKYLGAPDRILKFNNYQIFVYKKEFASHLPGWF